MALIFFGEQNIDSVFPPQSSRRSNAVQRHSRQGLLQNVSASRRLQQPWGAIYVKFSFK